METKGSRGADRLDLALGLLSSIPLGLIVVLTFADVFARYVFATPIRGSVEIIQNAMAMTIFAALPLVTRHREHVTVSLIDGLLRRVGHAIKRRFCDLISFLVLLAVTWRLWVHAGEASESAHQTIVLGLPEGPLVYAMSVFALLTAGVVLLHLLQGSSEGEAS